MVGSNHPRWLEVLPGALTWGVFVAITICSFLYPVATASAMIVFALFWLGRAFMMSVRLIVGYIKYRRDVRRDWQREVTEHFPAQAVRSTYHVVILAVSKEDPEIILASVKALAESGFNLKQIFLVVATEGRFAENGAKVRKAITSSYAKTFADLLFTVHPPDLPGEVVGKGGNITWAAKQVRARLDAWRIPYERVICTTLDADNRVHPKYFAALTHAYLVHPAPLYATFQPLPMFFNNIWDVPMPIRSIALGSSFWQIIESTRPHRLRNFSAHAQSFAALVKTNYWSTTTIVEDGHQFWRSYFRFNGRHDVVPINVPIYQDAVLSPKGYWQTFREQYIQKRRWAWGASDIPYVLSRIWRNKKLPFVDKWYQAFRLIEGHFSWATTSPILALFAWMPRVVAPSFDDVVIAHTFPPLYGRLLTLALLGLVVTLAISALLLPPVPKKRLVRSRASVILEWVSAPFVLPIANVFLGSLPAIDAQTRLMLGKYLEFRPTEKHVYRQSLKHHPAAQ